MVATGGFMRENVIRTVDAYLNGLGAKDISAAPFHPDIEFEGPVGPPIKGAATLRAVLTGFFPTIKGINIVRHIVDGERCATVFNFDTTFGIIPMIDCFHVVNGQIMSIRLYYDPRPMLEAMNRVAVS
jgi:limonene-1,2-epoxide hydrolase